jgi:hypothetical protein
MLGGFSTKFEEIDTNFINDVILEDDENFIRE